MATRRDVDVVRDPAHTISTVLLHRAVGTNKRRRRVPKVRHPKAVEVAYAKALVGIIDAAREHVKPLLAQLPALLASADAVAQRGDGGAFLSRELEAVDDRPFVALSRFAGLPIVIENPKGSTRSWTSRGGDTGATLMLFDYGYIAGAIGADGDEVDVYLGPDESSQWVYIVHQNAPPDFTEFDEDKVMLGFESAQAAADAYLAQYDDPRFLAGITPLQLEDFKQKLIEHEGGQLVRTRLDAGESKKARDLVESAKKKLADAVHPNVLDSLARKFGRRTTDFQREQLKRQTSAALGVDIVTHDKHLPGMIDSFAHENVALIKSLGNRTMDDVEKLVTRAFTSGTRHEELADDIQERFDVSERHARMIARDQVGKLNGQITAARHQELGLTRFNWLDSGDDKVREEHVILGQGGPYEYADPPSEGLPGEPILCRCTADPVFEDILDAIDEAGADDSGD